MLISARFNQGGIPPKGEPRAAVGRIPVIVTGGLGQGGYATVLKAAHAETLEPFAMKAFIPLPVQFEYV